MEVARRTRCPAVRRGRPRLRAPGRGPQTPCATARQETSPLEGEGRPLSPAVSLTPNQGGSDGGRSAYWMPSGEESAPASAPREVRAHWEEKASARRKYVRYKGWISLQWAGKHRRGGQACEEGGCIPCLGDGAIGKIFLSNHIIILDF